MSQTTPGMTLTHFPENKFALYVCIIRFQLIKTKNTTMTATQNTAITIKTTVHAPVEKVWQYWSEPKHITQWCTATAEWHTPRAENDLRTGGTFVTRMEAKDGSMGFDFGGVYDDVKTNEYIAYTMGDGRKVSISFESNDGQTTITETFDPESQNPREMQQAGWQNILDNFKKYTETN